MLVSEVKVEGVVVEGEAEELERARMLENPDEAPPFVAEAYGGEEPAFDECPDEEAWWFHEEPLEAMSKGKRNKELGRRGEQAAARYLEYLGYEIVGRNWECPAGEADIVAYDGDCLVFVEVKTRTDIHKGFPSEAVTPKKRKRYERIAAWYLSQNEVFDTHVRFDVVALLVIREDRAMIKHYVNAFGWEH